LPVAVDMYVNGKAERNSILIRDQKQTFTLTASGAVQLVNFDAERQLLCDLSYKKSLDEYKFQYANAPLFADRLEALRSMELLITDAAVFEVFARAARQDKSPEIRTYAIGKIERTGVERAAELKSILTGIYETDQKTLVRAKALAALNKRYSNDVDIRKLNEEATNAQSYAICAEALMMLSKVDVPAAMAKAKKFENERGREILFAVSSIYADHGGDEQMVFFHESMKQFSGFDLMGYCSLYAKAAKRSNDVSFAITAAQDFELVSKGANKFVKYAATKASKDLKTVWETKSSDMQTALAAAKKEGKSNAELEKKTKETQETYEIISKLYEKMQ